jgi:NTE family protein
MLTPDATTAEKLQKIGAVALSTQTVTEAVRRDVIAQRLPSHDWPDRVLRIPAIDTATGEVVTFDRNSGVGLVDVVAASCAVPAVWPPVTIGERRYMDGGVGSSVNMALADDCEVAVVLAPSGRSTPSPFGGGAAEEVDAFGGSTFGVFADDESVAAFGPNPLDPACRKPSALAGREQGRRVAAAVADFLGA